MAVGRIVCTSTIYLFGCPDVTVAAVPGFLRFSFKVLGLSKY